MESGSGLSASDVLALTRDNGYNTEGFNFWWVIVFLIVAGMFGGNGFFGNRGNAENALLGEDEFIKRDIFNTNQNVSNTAAETQKSVLSSTCQTQRDVLNNKYDLGMATMENRYTTQLANQQAIMSQKDCCCQTNQNIIENRYNNALGQATIQKDLMQNRYDNATGQAAIQKDMLLGNKDIQAQMAECCCSLKTEAAANTQKILDKMCETEINNLRERLNERDRELQSAQFQISQVAQTNSLVNQLKPYPVPAYITGSPYASYNPYYGYGYGVSSVV